MDVLLDRIDLLPTPTAVAMRLMTLLESDAVTVREVVDLISTDPALSARVVGLCARSPKGRALGITSVDRAVVLLGFDAVRAAALSVRLFEVAEGFAEKRSIKAHNFDGGLFWRHSLAVAVLSERIAQMTGDVRASSAFIGGLLHDVGHLALHSVAPQVFESACDIADTQCSSVDLVSRVKIGIDGRTAGRRIGIRWGLPQELIDAIWLIDQPLDVIRGCTSSQLVKVISLADAVIARDHVAIRGHGVRVSAIHDLARDLQVDVQDVLAFRAEVLEEVESRAGELGLDKTPTSELLLQSVARANTSVSRFALAYRESSEEAEQSETVLGSLASFFERMPFLSLADAVDAIGASARSLAPGATACVIIPPVNSEDNPSIYLSAPDGIVHCDFRMGMPSDIARDVLSLNGLERCGAPRRLMMRNGDMAIVALGCKRDSVIHDFEPNSTLCSAWAAALDDALSRTQADQLSERLAIANRELAAHREYEARARAASAIGAIASGAAHEINTPLSVIAGRAHLLEECLRTTELGQSAADLKQAAMKVAEIVESLAESVGPIELELMKTDVGQLLEKSCRCIDPRLRSRLSMRLTGEMPDLELDPAHIQGVLVELLENALRASNDREVVLEAYDSMDGFVFKVSDYGPGFSEEALEHAFDPFFSEQPAGRRKGLGLSTARRLVEAHGGSISLRNRRSAGTGGVVCVTLRTTSESALTDGLSLGSSRKVA